MQTSPADRPPPRLPVQARSARTRARLLAATIEVLVELGYAGARTTEIAARAGVSQGALYKHFPTKLDLLDDALAQLLSGLRDRFDAAFAADPEAERDPAGTVFRHMWDAFTSRELQAGFELYLAARTDQALAERVVPVIEDHRSRIAARARALFPDAARDHENYDGAVQALVSTLQGAAIMGALLPPDSEIAASQRRSIERMVRLEFSRSTSSE